MKDILTYFYNFKGTASRPGYIFHWLLYFIFVSIVAIIIFYGLPLWSAFRYMPEILLAVLLLLILGYFTSSAAIAVRRLHDLGHSGWWYVLKVALTFVLPVFGLGILSYGIFLEFGLEAIDSLRKFEGLEQDMRDNLVKDLRNIEIPVAYFRTYQICYIAASVIQILFVLYLAIWPRKVENNYYAY